MTRNTSLSEVLLALDSFIKREGHACVPMDHIERGLRLGDAVDLLKKRHGESVLPRAVAIALQQREGWFWKRGVTADHRFIEAAGGFSIVQGHMGFRPGSALHAAAEAYRADFADGRLDADVFWALQSFPGWRWEPVADRGWGDRYREMVAFAAAEGHTCVPDLYNGSTQLGNWVTTQRARYRENRIIPSRIRRMEMLEGWEWQPGLGVKERFLTELAAHVKEAGSVNVPSGYVTAGGFALGAALNRMRRLYHRGDLSERRVQALEAFEGWTWGSGPLREAKDQEFFESYRAFVEREGHGNVPGDHIESGFRLGRSIVSTRYRMNKGALAASRIEALDAIDPSWRLGQRGARREGIPGGQESNPVAA